MLNLDCTFSFILEFLLTITSTTYPLPLSSPHVTVMQLKLETIRTLSREPGHRKFMADVLEYKQMRIYH